jgi:hypothetical protein
LSADSSSGFTVDRKIILKKKFKAFNLTQTCRFSKQYFKKNLQLFWKLVQHTQSKFITLKFDEKNVIKIFAFRFGFCGEAYPRFILPTEVQSIRDVLKKTDTSLYDQTVAFFNKIFFE